MHSHFLLTALMHRADFDIVLRKLVAQYEPSLNASMKRRWSDFARPSILALDSFYVNKTGRCAAGI